MTEQQEAAIKLALEALEMWCPMTATYLNTRDEAITALRQALEQPAQSLPFGVGGGLVAIKTLLSRDPCAHAKVAIEMIDAILAEQPAQQEQGDSICQENDGCPTELAVLQKFWRGQSIPDKHYPAWFKPAQQEPVAWVVEDQYGERLEWAGDADVGWGLKTFALYTRPQAREPLTDEQILRLVPGLQDCLCDPYDYNNSGNDYASIPKDMIRLARAIEAAHGIGEEK